MLDNVVSWFDIPVVDFDKSLSFYTNVLNIEMQVHEMSGSKMALFPHDKNVSGCIVENHPFMQPSSDGPLIYLNAGDDLSGPLSRVEDAGGMIIMKKTKISDEIGFMAIFTDPDGNKLAFHSKN